MSIYTRIAGMGSYLPERVLTNEEMAKLVDTSDTWIQERTGIKKRHIAADYETSSSLALEASKKALEAANLTAEDIDMIIVGTTTPDKVFPSTACFLQDALGLRSIPSFDVSAACAGFIYAMTIVDQFIKTGAIKNALIVGVEVMSRIINWDDRATCVLFGDGAGAAVLSATDEPGILSTHIHADGCYKDLLFVGSPLKHQDRPGDTGYVQMLGKEVFKVAVRTLSQVVDETLEKNKIGKSDIDWLIPHQANMRIITATAKQLDMTMDQVIVTVDQHANTSAASIPLAMDCAIRDGRIQRGQTLLLETFGGGFAWGSALIKY